MLRIRDLRLEGSGARCIADQANVTLPRIILGYLRVGDQIRIGSSEPAVSEFIATHAPFRHGGRKLYLCRIGYVIQPKTDQRNGHFTRAGVEGSLLGIKWLHIPDEAIRDHFYLFECRPGEGARTLYEHLGVAHTASFADLRLCYRIRRVELAAQGHREKLRSVERAFNLLANPEIRRCYDTLLLDRDAPALFPYAGSGQCLASGDLAEDGETFFVRRLLSYVPDRAQRSLRVPLRRIDFFDGYAVYNDARRKVDIILDPCLLPLEWDPTWNQWKHLIGAIAIVSGSFVDTTRYRIREGAWELVKWQTAIPSRISLMLPEDTGEGIAAARRAFERFGEYYDAIQSIRARLQHEPISEEDARDLCRTCGIPADLDVAQLCWQPDYDSRFYRKLRDRRLNMYLFRNEYVFEVGRFIVAEVPQRGRATYVFTRPNDMPAFLKAYARSTRDDIRHNRGNVARQLGFTGRVMHGRDPEKWLRELLKRTGAA